MAALFVALVWRGTMHMAAWAAPMSRGPDTAPRVSLTFDVAWGDGQVMDVLRVLDRLQAKATFFVSGPWAIAHPDLARRLHAAGQELGVLGWRQERLSRLPDSLLSVEATRARDAVGTASGGRALWFRPPYGDYDTHVLAAVRRLGMRPVTWTADGRDEGSAAPGAIADRVVRAARPGAIIRLHADEGAPATDDALEAIIERLRGAGYVLVTLHELVANGSR